MDEIADQRAATLAAADARTDFRQENAVALETIADRVRDAVTQVLASAHGDRAEAFDDVAEFLRRETDPLTWLDDAADYAWNEGLDRATNFFSGYADIMTFNVTKAYRNALPGDYVDYGSTEYAAGMAAGGVMQFALGLVGGLGVCNLGRLGLLINSYNAAPTVHGVTTSGYQVFVNGDATWTDYLTLATAAGFGIGRLGRIGGLFWGGCFVGETEVQYIEQGSSMWLATSIGVFAVPLAAAAVVSSRRREEEDVDKILAEQGDGEWHEPDERLPDIDPDGEQFDQLCDKLFESDDEAEFWNEPMDESWDDSPETNVGQASSLPMADDFSNSASAAAITLPRRHCHRAQRRAISTERPSPSANTQPSSKSSANRHGWLIALTLLSLIFGSFCLWKGVAERHVATKPIQEFTAGMIVPEDRIHGDNDLTYGEDVDPKTWKRIFVRGKKPERSTWDADMLQPPEWLAEQHPHVGGTVHVSVPECGIDGTAEVVSLNPCPDIANVQGGQVVTAVFRHHSANVLDLHVEGLVEPIGTTANHPFWSEDRKEFVRADELHEGERLLAVGGKTPRVLSLATRNGTRTVYNLQVHVDHMYHVTEAGILVHNAGSCQDRVIVIGEGMARVKTAARHLRSKGTNAKWYQAWSKNFPTNRKMTAAEFAAAKARNERWIRGKMDQGYTIYDIGIDPNRVGGRSPFYELETQILTDFPVIPFPGF